MPRKKKSEEIVETVEPMKDDAMNPPVENPSVNEKNVDFENLSEKNDENSPSSLSSFASKKIIRTSANFVNIRQEPNGEILFKIPNGSHILVEEDCGEWLKVTGYVMKSLVSDN